MDRIKFDAAKFMDTDEAIQGVLDEIQKEGTPEDLVAALGHAARAKGIANVSKETGISRTSLYKVFKPNSKPQFSTVYKILKAVGGRLVFPSSQDQMETT